MSINKLLPVLLSIALCTGLPVYAQSTAEPQTAPSEPPSTPAPALFLGTFNRSNQWRLEQISTNHLRLTGQVELEGNDLKFFADEVELFTDTNRVVASGNVVFTNPGGRVSAERVVFDTGTNTGTFYMASGILSLGPKADRAQFGNQDPDVYFYGEMLEKLGDKQYRVTHGGFTTCVQPTPRWEIASDSVMLNLDEYAIARNMVLRVKGVPLMYMPLIYYPIQKENRATGFLLPTYGSSTLRGQSFSNAFFWVLGRSQDATFFHDWFTRTGQGGGAEYRYVAGQQSSGNFRIYAFDQHQATFTQAGRTNNLPAKKSYEFRGTANQGFAGGLRGRARIDYVSDLINQQLYQQNIYRSTNSTRVLEGGVSGAWRGFATSALYQRTEYFSGTNNSSIYGSTPRITAAVAPQRLFGLPFYGSVNGEYAFLPYLSKSNGLTTSDRSLGRFDLLPNMRLPLSRLTFLSVNASASYRTTYYTRSVDAKGKLVPQTLLRQYVSLRSDVIGPVFTRIWDRPDSSFAARLKHVIEPTFSIDYITDFSNESRTPSLADPSDFVVGGAMRFTYGLHNRLFSRARAEDGTRGQTREFISTGIQQTYYSNSRSSRFDTAYATASGRPKPVDLSPVAMVVRVSPTSAFDANAKMEFDVSGNGMQIFTTGASTGGRLLSTNVSYSRYHYTVTSKPNSYLTSSTTTKFREGQFAGTYGLSWDIGRSYIVSQSVMASYLAQCCGLQAEFQTYNYPQGSGFPILADRRFNFSFVLAGLGTFSNFFGAFGGLTGAGR